ncbi:uncharacterized protein TNCV_1324841 [Trichonephila clavipes]|nr:uncharacterized protein TNCV_1324841 [Trichonephila clavipes]
MLYHRMVLEPYTAYPIPAGTRYILLTVQKTVFGLDIIPEIILPQLRENGFNLGDFRKMKRYDQKAYKLPPIPAHISAERIKRPLEQQPGPSFKKNRVFQSLLTTPPELTTSQIPDPSVQIPDLPAPIPPELMTPQILLPDPPQPPKLMTPQILLPDPPPVKIPDPPVQTTPQILLPDPPPVKIPDPPVQTTPQILLPGPPPVVETLELSLTDDSSMDQIMASVFGDDSQQGIPPAHT